MREQKAANNAANNVAGGKGNIDVERLKFRKACGFEKDDRVAENGVATKDLGSPNDAVLREGVSRQRKVQYGNLGGKDSLFLFVVDWSPENTQENLNFQSRPSPTLSCA